ncbi:hypothetical protein [Paenibacillus auburnensis]|nr:hypothetical protein [Paenibacillus auburnensis]
MTLNHYLGSDRPLPAGSFGYVFSYQKYADIPKSDDPSALHNIIDLSHLNDTLFQVFESDLDAAGLEIADVTALPWRQKLLITKPYVYGISGSFTISKEMREQSPLSFEIGRKCIGLLLSHMNDHMEEGESMEIYSCWDSELEMDRNPELDSTLHLPDFQLGDVFELADKQLIRVTK